MTEQTSFKIHTDTVLSLAIPEVEPEKQDYIRKVLETEIFKNCKFLFQKYDISKKTYIADVKIMRTTSGGNKK